MTKSSKDNPVATKALIVPLAKGTIGPKDRHTSRNVDEAIRIAKELGTVYPGANATLPLTVTSAVPLPDLWKMYAKERNAADGWTGKTISEMHGPVKRYQDYCDKKNLDAYAEATAASYKTDYLLTAITKQGTKFKPATVNQHIDRLSALFKWAIDNDKVSYRSIRQVEGAYWR